MLRMTLIFGISSQLMLTTSSCVLSPSILSMWNESVRRIYNESLLASLGRFCSSLTLTNCALLICHPPGSSFVAGRDCERVVASGEANSALMQVAIYTPIQRPQLRRQLPHHSPELCFSALQARFGAAESTSTTFIAVQVLPPLLAGAVARSLTEHPPRDLSPLLLHTQLWMRILLATLTAARQYFWCAAVRDSRSWGNTQQVKYASRSFGASPHVFHGYDIGRLRQLYLGLLSCCDSLARMAVFVCCPRPSAPRWQLRVTMLTVA